jgi:hypothetical protein
LFDQVDFGKLELDGGGVEHMGDNTTGEGDGDDESVQVTLSELDPSVTQLFFFVILHHREKKTPVRKRSGMTWNPALSEKGVSAQEMMKEHQAKEAAFKKKEAEEQPNQGLFHDLEISIRFMSTSGSDNGASNHEIEKEVCRFDTARCCPAPLATGFLGGALR